MPLRRTLTLVLCTLATVSVAAAQPAAEGAALVTAEPFADDDAWHALVSASADPAGGVHLEAQAALEGGASGAAPGERSTAVRGSLDVDVVSAIVADRARQVAMRAVADAISEVGGVGADRRYILDLVEAATDVLLDNGGLQRANVEALVRTVVRVVLAEIVVRTRLPQSHLLDRPGYWERRLCASGAGYRRQTADGLRNCNRLRMGLPEPGVDRKALRLYLVDLAYWRLGASGLFGDLLPDPPPCPFRFGEPGNALCQVLTQAATDRERDARIDWALDLDRVRSGLFVARALQGRFRPDGPGLRGILGVVASSTEVGAFGLTAGLRLTDWLALGELADDLEVVALRAALGRLREPPPATREEVLALAVGLREGARRLKDLLPHTRLRDDDSAAAFVDALLAGADRAQLELVAGNAAALFAHLQRGVGPTPEAVAAWLEALEDRRQAAARTYRARVAGHDPAGAAAPEPLGEARARLDRATATLSVRVWGRPDRGPALAPRDPGRSAPRSLATLELADLGELVEALRELRAVIADVHAALSQIPPDVWDWEATEEGANVHLAATALDGTSRLLGLCAALNLHSAREAGLRTVQSIVRGLASLAAAGAEVATPILDLLGPALPYLEWGRPLDTGALFQLVYGIRERDVLMALGVEASALQACADDEGGLACWTVRIVQSLREATARGEGRILVDGARFRQTLATLGEDFRARRSWRWYFHLTVGLGQLGTFAAAPGDEAGTQDRLRLVPLVTEQIGLGYASPSFWGDNFTGRVGIFVSGLLYRAVLDSRESDAMMLGAFAAVDLYELLELYVAPALLLFPGSDDTTAGLRFAVAVGAQVPLGDYLSAL